MSASRLPFTLSFALRDLRGGLQGFWLLLLCLALGVAAIGAVGLLSAAVDRAVARDARALLGGDIVVEASGEEITAEELGDVLPPGSIARSTLRMSGLVTSETLNEAGNPRSLAISLKGVEDPWPLVGTVTLDPPLAVEEALADGGVVVERGVLPRLGVEVGDRLNLGDRQVTIRAVLIDEPERVQGIYGIGPRVIASLDTIRAAGILLPGAVTTWTRAIALPPGADAAAVLATIREANPSARFRARGIEEIQPQIARFTDRLASYLTIAALAALLTGGIGIGLAVQGWLVQRRAGIATLKALGATPRQVLLVYALQVLLVATIAALLGMIGAYGLASMSAFLPPDLIPFAVDGVFDPWPLLRAALLGIATALLFAAIPLLDARDLPVAALLRPAAAENRHGDWKVRVLVIALGVLVVGGLASLTTPRPEIGAVFALAALAAAFLLTLLGKAVLALVGRAAKNGPLVLRLSLARLNRPGSTALPVVVATGTALSVLATVLFVQQSLESELRNALPERAPSVVFIDIQPNQAETFDRVLAEFPDASIQQRAPVLRARVSGIKGKPIEEAAIGENARWTVRRDRGLSWTATPPDNAPLVAGEWWPPDYAGPPLVSVEDEIAIGYGVGVGDKISFNVLGRQVEATVANLRREIDWSRARIDFVFLFSPGLIDKAPHTLIAAVRVPPGQESALLDAMAAALPNVTPISITEVTRQVGDVLGKIGFAVQAVASVTLGAGLLVLLGALAASRRQRRHQVALMKVLGATRADLLRHFVIEHAATGFLSALVGLLVGGIAAFLLVGPFMNLTFTPGLVSAAALALAAVVATGLVGALSTWRLLARPIAPVLRGG
ncbi:MAG TPA: FtsX-like permease family protein [Geminicoccus sp.]|jgi:putative ABC transport system permease protein|uniref:ABC transporter permease n=1 Tax=Geminicoccus sp. TaxID=2024832 RepID=UPI002E3696B5|nr:FtsX-like permease family protein [Geminicoccus sp.]HEX2526219.1 FtsX-like permease family protein [Geminicoccus sp.]